MHFRVAVILLPSFGYAALQCYNVQGTTLDDSYAPCNPDATVSPCCQLNHTTPDVCLGAGLCMSIRDDYAGTIWGNGCTDRLGNDKVCPQICAGKVDGSDFWSVMQCPEQGAWCCRAYGDWSSCCNKTSRLVSLHAADVTPQLPSTTESNGTAANSEASGTTITTTSVTVIPTDIAKESINTGLVAGVVGGVLGFAFLISLAAAILLWKQNQRLKESAKGHGTPEHSTPPATQYSEVSDEQKLNQYPQQWTTAVEVDSTPSPQTMELDGRHLPSKGVA